MAAEIVNNIRQAIKIQHSPQAATPDDFRRALTFLDEFKGSPQCLEVSMSLVQKEVRCAVGFLYVDRVYPPLPCVSL